MGDGLVLVCGCVFIGLCVELSWVWQYPFRRVQKMLLHVGRLFNSKIMISEKETLINIYGKITAMLVWGQT